MAYSLEAAMHIPLCLVLLSFAVMQFPAECRRGLETAGTFVLGQEDRRKITEKREMNDLLFFTSRPERMIEIILWGADSVSTAEDFLKSEGFTKKGG